MINEKLYRLDEIYYAIDSMGRRAIMTIEHHDLCVKNHLGFTYLQKLRERHKDQLKAVERIKAIAIKEHLKLIEELK